MRLKVKTVHFSLYITFGIVLLLNLFLLLSHEPWRDEAQAWLIARDVTFPQLITVLSQEGHPILWYAILAPFARLGFPYITMGIISYVAIGTTLFFFILYSPFHTITKHIFAFSPAVIYFLPVIARSYCLCALLVILIAVSYHDRFEHPLIYGVLISLLLQTHILMCGMAFILWYIWLSEYVRNRREEKRIFSGKTAVVGLLLPVLSAIFLLIEFSRIFSAEALSESSMLGKPIYPAVGGGAAVVLAVLLFAVLISRKFAVTSLLKGCIIAFVSIAFQFVIYLVYHHMTSRWITLVYILVFFFWITYESKCMVPIPAEDRAKRMIFDCAIDLALILCIVGYTFVSHGYSLAFSDVQKAYSDSKNTASYINVDMPGIDQLVCNCEESCNSLVPYLKDKTIFDPFTNDQLSFVNRDKNNVHEMSFSRFIEICKRENDGSEYVYCVFSRETWLKDVPKDLYDTVEVLYQTPYDSTISKEEYTIFKLELN